MLSKKLGLLIVLWVLGASQAFGEPGADGGAVVESSDGYLSLFWQDTLTIIGGAGFVLTAIGVWIACLQMARTTTANQAATKAAVNALAEGRDQYNRYVIAQASRLASEARLYVKKQEWSIAAIRLSDLADLLLQVAGDDTSWANMAKRLHAMEGSFDRIQIGEITYSDGLKGKWRKLQRELRLKIGENFGPYGAEN